MIRHTREKSYSDRYSYNNIVYLARDGVHLFLGRDFDSNFGLTDHFPHFESCLAVLL